MNIQRYHRLVPHTGTLDVNKKREYIIIKFYYPVLISHIGFCQACEQRTSERWNDHHPHWQNSFTAKLSSRFNRIWCKRFDRHTSNIAVVVFGRCSFKNHQNLSKRGYCVVSIVCPRIWRRVSYCLMLSFIYPISVDLSSMSFVFVDKIIDLSKIILFSI